MENNNKKFNNITPFEEDTAKWYSDIIKQADLIMYAPVKGTVFLQPYAYKIWDLIKTNMNKEFVKKGVEEVYFPLLFPLSLLEKEKDHIDGFAPEVLLVTHVGKDKFEDPLVVRPTSEILFNTFFAQKLTSYKQLPYKLNQWANVTRWENNTRPFLRTSEFLWQEGHTNHETMQEADKFAKDMLDVYYKFVTKYLRLPVIKGVKSSSEKFAGADKSYTIEAILKDGQALQSGTSHLLGQNFTKAFNVRVQGKDNQFFNPYQTSWGTTTRLIGATILAHSDNKGLVLPSEISPVQVVLMVIGADKDPAILATANKLKKQLSGITVHIDTTDKGFGFKSQEWETKGVPIRIPVGLKEVQENTFKIIRRDQESNFDILKLENVTKKYINDTLVNYSKNLFFKAEANKESKIVRNITNYTDLVAAIKAGFVVEGYWVEDKEVEAKLKLECGATIRCFIKPGKVANNCIHSGKKTKNIAIIARAY